MTFPPDLTNVPFLIKNVRFVGIFVYIAYTSYICINQKKITMIIKLVSCSCVDNMQYYDAIVCYPGIEFAITSVYYDVLNHVWSVKVPNKPLFETILFSELMQYLTDVIRDLFYR